MSEEQNTRPAPASATRPRSYVCWLEDTTDVSVIDAVSHGVAAKRYMHQLLARFGADIDAPGPDKVGVVELESGESHFIYVKVVTTIVDHYETTGANDAISPIGASDCPTCVDGVYRSTAHTGHRIVAPCPDCQPEGRAVGERA